MSKVKDVEVSAFSECFLFILISTAENEDTDTTITTKTINVNKVKYLKVNPVEIKINVDRHNEACLQLLRPDDVIKAGRQLC